MSNSHQSAPTLLKKKSTAVHDDKHADDSSSDEEPRKLFHLETYVKASVLCKCIYGRVTVRLWFVEIDKGLVFMTCLLLLDY